eukprot:CAMPEP_0170604242 /NCGR_PEP_ID=MMETSP0224-20130122/19319_1 /TAXON_ID=285029 /ORGANISM="Togula jolla, Strain CCCM 725" /LENGTH=542 /DNA_ID=CAMNT_0010929133 /DNA_START=64 /DNA_END=1692 /DNA_ORIENTATION=+
MEMPRFWGSFLLLQALRRSAAVMTSSSAVQQANLRSSQTQDWSQVLNNIADAAYTMTITVGGETIEAIPDTGSFDLLVFSSDCKSGCGPVKRLYNKSASMGYEKGQLSNMHQYGSGSAWSMESYDIVSSGPMWAHHQLFWEVYSADMPILQVGDFQSILGLGPPDSSVTMAEKDAEEVRQELDYLRSLGEVTPAQEKIANNCFELAKAAKNARSLLTRFDLHSFSICLGAESGSPGRIVWKDRPPQEWPVNVFRTIEMQEGDGDLFWSAKMEYVALGAMPQGHSGAKRTPVGCMDGACTAIVDSGTSLIVAPQEAAWKVEEALEKWRALSGNCTDLSSLPNLEFMMGGIPFSLPPESYVGDLHGDFSNLDPALRRFLPHLERHTRLSSEQSYPEYDTCTPLIMVMESGFGERPQWILGMPFLRQYYTMFTVGPGSAPWRRSAKSMSFARADASCQPKHPEELLQEQEQKVHGQERRMRIDVAKLRLPHWATRKRPSLRQVPVSESISESISESPPQGRVRIDVAKLRVPHYAARKRPSLQEK